MSILNTLNTIPLDRVAYVTDVPVYELTTNREFMDKFNYGGDPEEDYEDTYTLDELIDVVFELNFDGKFSKEY